MPQSLVRDYNEYYSQTYPYAAGTSIPVQIEPLRPALRLRRPVLDKIVAIIDYNVTVGASDTSPFYLSQLFGAINLTDAHGERINFSDGSYAAVFEQIERGLNKVAADGPDLVNGGVRTGRHKITIFDGSPMKAARSNDYGIPLRELMDVGRFTCNWSSRATLGGATGITAINAGTQVTFEFWVREEVMDDNEVELKSRNVRKDYGLTQRDYPYPINGASRGLYAFGGYDAGGAAQSTGFTTLTSSELRYYARNIDILVDRFFEEHDAGTPMAPLNSMYDLVFQGFVRPFVWTKRDQKTALMPIIEGGCQLLFDVNPTLANKPVILVESLMDRSMAAAAVVMGAPNEAAATQQVRQSGHVRSLLGTDRNIALTINREVSGRLPIRVRLPGRK